LKEIRIQVAETNLSRVESEVGLPFYTHLLGLNRIADTRCDAVERAVALYDGARQNELPEPRIAGYGLLVLQRTGLICEDLLAVLSALNKQNPWKALTNYRARDLDSVCRGYLESGYDLLKFFLAPKDATVTDRAELSDEQRDALLAWARETRDGQTKRLQLVASFWLSHAHIGKATMHGYGMVARQFLNEPPGGGALSRNLTHQPTGLFAAALISRLRTDQGQQLVETEPHYAELHAEAIELLSTTAFAAQNLLYELRSAQVARLTRDAEWHLHGAYLDRLTPEQQDVLRSMEPTE
jgi:hypothetical protein